MKKITSFLLAVLMLISVFASCGGNDITTTTEIPTTETPTTETPTTELPTTEAPTTEAPTTEAPTTEAPTTEAPTTEAPTVEIPTTEYEYVAYEMGGYLNFYNDYGLKHDYELDESIRVSLKKDPTVPEKMTIEYEGVKYECTYYMTRSNYGYVYYDIYNCTLSTPDGEERRSFGLDRDTKKIVYYIFNADYHYIMHESRLPYIDLKKMAEDFLGKCVTDPEAYILVKDSSYGHPEFVFSRYIGEIETFDKVTVRIDEQGNLRGFDITNTNKLKDFKFSKLYDDEKLTHTVITKLDTIYGEAFEKSGFKKMEHRFDSKELVKLANGQCAMAYDVYTFFSSYRGDRCHILAYLN